MSDFLDVIVVNPRGFCAGVKRAIDILNITIENNSAPIYVNHDIVHNKSIVADFKKKNVIFAEPIENIPSGSLFILSAHGVSDEVESNAKQRNLEIIDATCPLVKKIHKEVIDYSLKGYAIILVGHKNHPEIIGTQGKIQATCYLVSSVDDAKNLVLVNPEQPLAYTTQTTLSLDDTKDIIDELKKRFPNIIEPKKQSICYATQNRQNAIKAIIHKIDTLIILGSKHSSNSNRLKEIGVKQGIRSFLIDYATDIPKEHIMISKSLAISAGASAPEKSVQEVIKYVSSMRNTKITDFNYTEEEVHFNLPKIVRKMENKIP